MGDAKMETQRILDNLTDHLGLYHRRASVRRTESRARQAVVEWMAGLTCEQRRAALTVVDASWMAILLMMQKRLVAEGAGTFFLLPDLPVFPKERVSAAVRATGPGKDKVDDSTAHGQGGRAAKGSGPRVRASSTNGAGKKGDQEGAKCIAPLPGLCFRRIRGLLKRLDAQQLSGQFLISSILLFHSEDGEEKGGLHGSDPEERVDSMVVTEDLVSRMETFLDVMDDLSHHEFLQTPCVPTDSPWEEMPWLKDIGYYSLPAFAANKLEIALWKAWGRAQGTKRPLKSLALRSKDTNQKAWSPNSLCIMQGNGAFAANVFERKQAVLDWWRKLAGKERVDVVNCAWALATKTEVLKITGEARAAVVNMDSSKPKGRLKGLGRDLCDSRSVGAHRRSLSDSELEQHLRLPALTEEGAAVAPYLTGLRVLKKLSESGYLGGKLEGMNFHREDDARWRFDSKLTSVHAFSDRVIRRVRHILVKLRNDFVQLELLGDESSGKGHKDGGGPSTGVRVRKTKKKRRKSTSSPKAEFSKEEEKTCNSNPGLSTDLRNERPQTECIPGEAEVQARNSDFEQAMIVPKAGPGGRQNSGRKGKRGTLKARREDVSGGPEIVPQKSGMNGELTEYKKAVKTTCEQASVEVGGAPCSLVFENGSLDSSASSVDEGLCSPISVGNFVVGRTKSSSVERSPVKVQHCPTPPPESLCNEVKVDIGAVDEVPFKGLGATRGPDFDICEGSSESALLASIQERPTMVENHHVPIKDRQCSIGKLSECPDFPTCDTPVPRSEGDGGASVSGAEYQPEPSRICFGTVDEGLPAAKNCSSLSVAARSAGNSLNTKNESDIGVLALSSVQNKPTQSFIGKVGQEERGFGASHGDGKVGTHSPNGVTRFSKNLRQLDYPNTRQLQYQQGPKFRSFPHEWPGSPQFGYFGAYHQPPATDWLQLDVGRGWPQRVDPSLLAFRNTPVLRQQSGHTESPTLRSVASRSNSLGNVDRSPLIHSKYNVSPGMDYAMGSKEEPRVNVRPLYSPSPFSSGYTEFEANGQGRNVDDQESEDRWAYDTDVDDFGVYKSGEFDDFDGYIVSEEEGDRCAENAGDSNSDYHQIFGGGVMYWNAADYSGLGHSGPGSMSSDDSSWARREADLSAVLDDIVNYPSLQSSFPSRGCSGSSVPSCSPSPPSSSLSFEHFPPVGSSNSRHCLPRHGSLGKFVQISNQAGTPEDQQGGTRVPITLEVIEQMRADSSAQPILRPIVVVHDPTLSRQLEALRLQEAKSPHIVPRSRRDASGHRKRPPSPVLRCVPPAPPPPPPSPVAGPRRRRGLMTARSGSSSPRHWGLLNWPHKDEQENSEDTARGEGPEGLLSTGRRKGRTSNPPMYPLSGALLRERLVAIPSISLEQEHPDVSIPMKTTLLLNSTPAVHLHLNKMLSSLHVQIEDFRSQVEGENKMRKPFINTAVKKVEHSLRVLWPRSRIHIFGSIATGLALPTSDVDLVVCLPPVRNLEPIKEAGILEGRNGIKETSLQHAARYLADQDWVKNDSMKTIENTMIPIIMMVAEILPHQCEVQIWESSPCGTAFCEDSTKIEKNGSLQSEAIICKEDKDCTTNEMKGPWGRKDDRQLVHLDISFETPSHTGLRTAELVRELVGQYPPLSPLSLVLKQFLTDRSLDHPYTGGLSSYCLVLLITRFLQHQQHQHQLFSSQNLGRLFMDFLHFFGCVFDPRRMGIRIRGGGMYVSRDRDNDIDPLYIEDPLHPNNNVGRNCFRILQCVKAFADGYSVLEKTLHAEFSNGPEDAVKDVRNPEVLQMMLPCIQTKR